jgi:hypothetical protein
MSIARWAAPLAAWQCGRIRTIMERRLRRSSHSIRVDEPAEMIDAIAGFLVYRS